MIFDHGGTAEAANACSCKQNNQLHVISVLLVNGDDLVVVGDDLVVVGDDLVVGGDDLVVGGDDQSATADPGVVGQHLQAHLQQCGQSGVFQALKRPS